MPRKDALFSLALLALAACHPQTVIRANKILAVAPADRPIHDTSLGVGDVFEVRVYGESELSGKYRVGGDGQIDFPFAGKIHVEGLQPTQVADQIGNRLRQGILRSPQISIYVHEQNSKKIHVIGQVSKPGTLAYTPGMSIIEAIAQAGGFTPVSAKNGTTVTRLEQGKKIIYQVPVGDIGSGLVTNFPVHPGDIVSVPERFF